MATVETRTYQASDLASTGRRQFLDAAKAGAAYLRDTDGTSLAMLPAAELATYQELRRLTMQFLALETTLTRDKEHRRSSDLGELAWALVLDDDDLALMRDEFAEALSVAAAATEVSAIGQLLQDWRVTATFLHDVATTDVLDRHLDRDVQEAERPTD